MEKKQTVLITMFEKSLGKSVVTEDESVVGKGDPVKGVGEGSERRSERSKLLRLQGDELVSSVVLLKRRSYRRVTAKTRRGGF
jgi:hypothetical protein